jgi:capsular exopolysaccharide synthesis family protein
MSDLRMARWDTEPEWRKALRILRANWKIAAVFALAVVAAVTLFSLFIPATYEPTARVRIDLPGMEPLADREVPLSTVTEQNYVDTEAEVFKSDALALAVIDQLHLDQKPEFAGPGILSRTLHSIGIGRDPNEPTARRERALNAFHQNFSVKRIRDSHLIEISFASHDRTLAADVTNASARVFIDQNLQRRYKQTMEASEWRTRELEDLRQKVESANQALADFQNATGIVDIDEKQNTVTQKVAELNRQLAQAQADRIQLEAMVNLIDAGRENWLPQVRENALVDILGQRVAEARGQLAQAMAIYGEDNFNVKKLRSEVTELDTQLNAERKRLVQQVRTSYDSARTKERLLASALNDMKDVISTMNDRLVQYNFKKKEAQSREDLYNNLFARLKESVMAAGLKASNIVVVDPARVLDSPTRPQRLQMIIVGMFVGLVGGLVLAFAKSSMSETIHAPADIKRWTGLPIITPMPAIPNPLRASLHMKKGPLALLSGNGGTKHGSTLEFFIERPDSPEAEAVRRLHNSIRLFHSDNPPHSMLVASAGDGEGKTTVSVNLASAFAQHSGTCLVCADMRKPQPRELFGISPKHGLSTVLSGGCALDDALLQVDSMAGRLWFLPPGPIPSNPGALVSSDNMRELLELLRGRFEHVIIDTPPLIAYSDVIALTPFVDGVILVGRCDTTTREEIAMAADMLEQARARVLGVVLNAVNTRSPYYRYYSHR